MKVTELENKGLKRSFKITVDAGRVEKQMDAELHRAGQNVKIPGFRPGFIPLKVLKQRYGKTVQADVLRNVVAETTNQVMAEKKMRPALQPQVNIENYQEGGDFSYTVSFEIMPEIPEMDVAKITLDREVFEIMDADVDEAMERIAKSSPEYVRAKEGAKAKRGQAVKIDFKGMVGGKAFEGGSAKDFMLELGSGRFIEGFEEQLVGAKEGDDIIVKVTFPKDYGARDLAGEEASFAVAVKEIHDVMVPAIDDTFAKPRGFDSAAAFREAVRGQLHKEYAQAVRQKLKRRLFDVLDEEVDFPLPQTMVDMEFGAIWQRIQEARKQGDESLAGKSEEELKDEYQNITRRRVKLGLFLADVSARNKLQITGEEINRAVMQQAMQFPGQEKQIVDFYRQNPQHLEELKGPILEEKAVDFILGKVKYNDEKVTLKSFEESQDEEGNSGAKKKPAKPKAKKKA